MQIGNNRPNGPQPRDNKNSHLDPDLTKSNRDGIERTAKVSAERIQEASKERSASKPVEPRSKPTDTFERSRPQDDPGMDVAERIKNARSQHMANRVGSAREQDAMKTSQAAEAMGERIANARAQHARQQGADEVRTELGTGDGGVVAEAKRIANARAQSVGAQGSDAVGEAKRADAARTQSVDAAAMATRIANARAQSVELPGPGGVRESQTERAERIESLRQAFEAGELNTPERAREAAGKLLSDE